MKLTYKIIFGIIICTLIIIYFLSNITEGEYYRRYSPDGQYSIYASKNKYFNLEIPFVKFGDSAGKINLYDELENKLIGSSSIDMISNINELFWSENELCSKGNMNNIKLPRKINSKIISKYQKSYPIKHSQNLFIDRKQYIVKVGKKSNRLTVSNKNGEILLQNIRYISQINNGFQVLNNNTEIEYYDLELNKMKNHSKINIKTYEVCGNVTTYNLKIEETKEYYIFKKAVGFTNYNNTHYNSIDSIKKNKVKDIYFLNKKRELKYDENIPQKELVIIDFGTYFGILSEQYGIEYFDSINLDKDIKVIRNNLYGFYNITPTVYSELEPFEFNLAKFKKTNHYGENIKGYVDRDGNEYYK